MAHIDAEELLPAERLQEAVLDGTIIQLHRGDAHATEGDTFEIEGEEFVLTDVTERRLGELTDTDARAEGSSDLDAVCALDALAIGVEWDKEDSAVRHRFERQA